MKSPSKTIGPLHFEDLEPHRFEDLVRKLIYDFRTWKSLEGLGRCGSDEGFDVRGVQIIESLDSDDQDKEDRDGKKEILLSNFGQKYRKKTSFVFN